LTTRYHRYIIADKSNEGQDTSLQIEMGNGGAQEMKKPELSRRYFIKASMATVATIALGNSILLLTSCSTTTPPPTTTTTPPPTTRGIPIPALLENTSPDPDRANFELVAQRGETEFFSGKFAETFGYNGSYLGPTIRVKRGQEVNIKVRNLLDEIITTHWHGALVPGEMDGGTHQVIPVGGEWNPHFTIEQPAATIWYHSHTLGYTGEQVYKGLAGLFIIDDEVSENLNIPKDYGINDIPLIIQDKRFAEDGSLLYLTNTHDRAMGMLGDTILVNGAISPVLEVSTVKMRFRIVNSSNARVYVFSLSDNSKFSQIASDNGFLESPVELEVLKLVPGERAEIIIDFSNYSVGDAVTLESLGFKIMDFSVMTEAEDTTTIPEKLTTINKIPESAAVKTRTFVLGGKGALVNINGQQMNLQTGMDTTHEFVNFGDTEIWEISESDTGMYHPFHVHGVHFQVLDRNGQKPPANEQGWKDTILINQFETVRVIQTFNYKGIYMLHCHNLEHEDAGMMLQHECI
jgi:FtsP/CotA-like multicopper oxidase with cupredoxin domain